ncbi:MAG: molybdopterin molybdotransferase MoeA, partial [Candidatus Binatia bacterium]
MPPAPAPRGVKPFFRVLTPEEAKRALQRFPPLDAETVSVRNASGRILAEDLFAAEDMPHFHRSNMDGYAVHAEDTFGASASQPGYLRLVGSIEMGEEVTQVLGRGEAIRIATGGMLPPSADAVVMVEYCEELVDGTVEIQRGASPWQNVLRISEDTRRGDLVFPKGRRLRAQDLGALSGVGFTEVRVIRRPRVALLSTGDEIVPPDAKPRPGQIRNVNQYSLLAMIEEAGGEAIDLGLVGDRAEDLRSALDAALRRSDLVLLSGGSSVGTKDMALDVIASFPDSAVLFHGISYAPGKPTLLARAAGLPVMGLPGHPVSALVTFRLFGAPLVRILAGEAFETAFGHDRRARATLGRNVASEPGREDYVRVTLETAPDGKVVARPMPGKSGAVFSLVRADGMVRIPLEAEGIEEG